MRLVLSLLFISFAVNTKSAVFHGATSSLKIVVTGLKNNSGHVLVSLFNDKSSFPGKPEKAIRKSRISIKDNKAWVLYTGLPVGTYAAAILHDENDDQKMNTNFLGIPKEGYGFSNNEMGFFGPPSFSKASFTVGKTLHEITIKTKY